MALRNIYTYFNNPMFMEKKEAEDLENKIVKFLRDPTYPASDKTLKGILEHVRNHKEIIKSEQERAKKDKIRRILDNSSKIHGYGNTRNRRYQILFSRVEDEIESSNGLNAVEFSLLFNAVQHDIFKYHAAHNKPIDNLTEFCRQRVLDWEESLGFDIDLMLFDKGINFLQHKIYPQFVDFGLLVEFTDNNDGTVSVRNASDTWFVPGIPFAGSAYIGFQGPELLKTVINNIVQNIDSLEDEFLKNLNHNSKENVSNIHLELKWLIDNKRSRFEQHKNKIAITLALLHLNRSLVDDYSS